MGSLGTPSAAAFTTITTITFLATITALTSGLITQCHPVLDAVLGRHAVLSHPAFHTTITCSTRQGSWAPDPGRWRGDGLEAPSVTFIIHSDPTHSLLYHIPRCVFPQLLVLFCVTSPTPSCDFSLSVTLDPTLPGLTDDREHGHSSWEGRTGSRGRIRVPLFETLS